MERRIEAASWAIMVLAAAVLGAQLGASGPSLPAVPVRLACVVKLIFLASGALAAFRCAARLEPGNPARAPWLLLALGLFSTLVGQANLVRYQFSPRIEAPFPSLADLFFVTGYPFFIAGLLAFVRACGQAGYPLGTPRERWLWGGVLATVALVIVAPLLLLVWRSQATVGAKALNIAYPVLDVTLLVPTAVLLRASLPLRGGRFWRVWALLLVGFALMGAGDVLFAYFSILGVTSVDPLVHAAYVVSYGCLAVGALRQHALLTG